MEKTFIETERLYLRRIKKDDENDFYNIMGNLETMKYLGKALSNEEINGFISSLINKEYKDIEGEYSIVSKKDNKTIGMFSIEIKKRDKKATISYMLNSEYWKKAMPLKLQRK